MAYEIAILDDHPMICDAIEFQVDQHKDFQFAGRYSTLAAANDLLSEKTVDVLVCDLYLPDGIAVPLIRRIARGTEIQVVVYTASEHPVISSICETAGAVATLTKRRFGDNFLGQVRESIATNPRRIQTNSVSTNNGKRADAAIGGLTEREWEILLLMGEGFSTVEIASRLFISDKTVESHRAAIKRKLNVTSKDRLISLAARWIGVAG